MVDIFVILYFWVLTPLGIILVSFLTILHNKIIYKLEVKFHLIHVLSYYDAFMVQFVTHLRERSNKISILHNLHFSVL